MNVKIEAFYQQFLHIYFLYLWEVANAIGFQYVTVSLDFLRMIQRRFPDKKSRSFDIKYVNDLKNEKDEFHIRMKKSFKNLRSHNSLDAAYWGRNKEFAAAETGHEVDSKNFFFRL